MKFRWSITKWGLFRVTMLAAVGVAVLPSFVRYCRATVDFERHNLQVEVQEHKKFVESRQHKK